MRRQAWMACAVLLAAWLAVDGAGRGAGRAAGPTGAEVAGDAGAYGDTLLAARVDSLGLGTVLEEIRGLLRAAAARMADTTANVPQAESEVWQTAMRWAATLGDEVSPPLLDAIASTPAREETGEVYPQLTRLARQAAYDIRAQKLAPAEQAAALLPQLGSPDAAARDFAVEQLLRLGSPALPPLLEYVKAEILPRVASVAEEPFSEEDLRPQLDLLHMSDLARGLVSTDADRALVEALARDADPHVRAFAQEVLGSGR